MNKAWFYNSLYQFGYFQRYKLFVTESVSFIKCRLKTTSHVSGKLANSICILDLNYWNPIIFKQIWIEQETWYFSTYNTFQHPAVWWQICLVKKMFFVQCLDSLYCHQLLYLSFPQLCHTSGFVPLKAPLPRPWGRCFNKAANWCSQCTLLLAAAVWILGVVQNLLWTRDIARLVPLSTCLTHSSAECSLPCQGRTEAQETTRRSEHLAAHHERTSGLLGKNTTNRAEINVSAVFLCFETEEAKVKRVSPRRFVQRRVPVLFKRLLAMRFPTRT